MTSVRPEPQQQKWFRKHCLWEVNKNTLKRYQMRWMNTLEREWHPSVHAHMTGAAAFDASAPHLYHTAVQHGETFILAHISTEGSLAQHLHDLIVRSRTDGTIVANDGRSLIQFLERWIIINDADAQAAARTALMSITLLPAFTIIELEDSFWWATNIVARLPARERTQECDVRRRMVEGLRDELAARRVVVQSQLSMVTMLGRGSAVSDAEFIKLLATQLAEHRHSAGIASSESFVQPHVSAASGQDAPTTFAIGTDRSKGKGKDKERKPSCWACAGPHNTDECPKPPCGKCGTKFCGIHFPKPVVCQLAVGGKAEDYKRYNGFPALPHTALGKVLATHFAKQKPPPAAANLPSANVITDGLSIDQVRELVEQVERMRITVMIEGCADAAPRCALSDDASATHALEVDFSLDESRTGITHALDALPVGNMAHAGKVIVVVVEP